MFRWRSLKNLRVIRSRCVLRVGGKRTLNKHPLGGWVLRMGESSFLTKLLVKLWTLCREVRHTSLCAVKTNDARFCKERQKETPYRLTRYGVLWTRRESNPRPFGCEPNALPTVSLLCTPYTPWEKENRRVFVHIKGAAMLAAFLGRKYGLHAADFQDEAVWGVIWLADKWATGPWDIANMGFRCIASQFTIKYDVP